MRTLEFESKMMVFMELAVQAVTDKSQNATWSILALVAETLHANRIALFACRGEEFILRAGYGSSMPAEGSEVKFNSLTLKELREKRFVDRPTEGVGWDYFLALNDIDGEMIGMLCIDDTEVARALNADEKAYLAMTAGLFTKILRGVKALQMDPKLQCLYSSAYGMNRLLEMGEVAKRNKEKVGLIFADIDDFKQVNTDFGHLQGDEVLLAKARSVAKNWRHGDTYCRYGGEEIVGAVIGGAQHAHSAATRIWKSWQEQFHPLSFSKDHSRASEVVHRRITGSFGVDEWDPSVESLTVALQRANDNMKRAKAGGKNRVCAG